MSNEPPKQVPIWVQVLTVLGLLVLFGFMFYVEMIGDPLAFLWGR